MYSINDFFVKILRVGWKIGKKEIAHSGVTESKKLEQDILTILADTYQPGPISAYETLLGTAKVSPIISIFKSQISSTTYLFLSFHSCKIPSCLQGNERIWTLKTAPSLSREISTTSQFTVPFVILTSVLTPMSRKYVSCNITTIIFTTSEICYSFSEDVACSNETFDVYYKLLNMPILRVFCWTLFFFA